MSLPHREWDDYPAYARWKRVGFIRQTQEVGPSPYKPGHSGEPRPLDPNRDLRWSPEEPDDA